MNQPLWNYSDRPITKLSLARQQIFADEMSSRALFPAKLALFWQTWQIFIFACKLSRWYHLLLRHWNVSRNLSKRTNESIQLSSIFKNYCPYSTMSKNRENSSIWQISLRSLPLRLKSTNQKKSLHISLRREPSTLKKIPKNLAFDTIGNTNLQKLQYFRLFRVL